MEGTEVVLTSPVDLYYGLRVVRRVRLDPDRPVMTIVTTCERVSGAPAPVGIWIITQLREPAAVILPRPAKSIFAQGFTLLGPGKRPPTLKVGPDRLLLRRDPQAAYKIGSDAGNLLWIGERFVCRIDSPRTAGAEYPDQGSSAEVWTNPDPLPYVELEMLGPLRPLKPGDTLSQTNTYALAPHTGSDLESE
jgi:hypothetical protein